MPATMTVELHPAGPEGGTLRERLLVAVAETCGDVTIRPRALVVELVPVDDPRPDATKLRLALKAIGRRAKLRAAWYAPARRHKPSPRPRKPKAIPVPGPSVGVLRPIPKGARGQAQGAPGFLAQCTRAGEPVRDLVAAGGA